MGNQITPHKTTNNKPPHLDRGVRGAVWFGFERKSHPNREIKSMRSSLVQLTLKIKSEPNQTNAVWVGSVSAVFSIQYNFLFSTLKSS